MARLLWGQKEWEVTVKWLDQMEDVGLSKNGITRAIVGIRAISKNRSAIDMSRRVLKKKGS